MITLAAQVSRLETIESREAPILSVYLDLDPGVGEMRSVAPRLRSLLYPIRRSAQDLDHVAAENLIQAVNTSLDAAADLERLVGHGVALFISPLLGLDERIVTAHRVWDCAMAGDRPYLRPLRAVLDDNHLTATLLVDARRVSILVVEMEGVVSSEVIPGEVIRKPAYAGWFALEESKSRRNADNARHRLFSRAGERIASLHRTMGVEAFFVGGQRRAVAEFVGRLDPSERALIAGTFDVDVHTTGDSELHRLAVEHATDWDRRREAALWERINQEAQQGGRAVVGLGPVLHAANRHAVAQLVVEEALPVPGWACGGCGALNLHGPVCGVCGVTAEPVDDVVDRLTMAVTEDGGHVVHLDPGTSGDGHAAAASLRFVPA